MMWYLLAGLGSLSWGLAYSIAYYPISMLKLNPLAFNVATKMGGTLLMGVYYLSRSSEEKQSISTDLKEAFGSRSAMMILGVASFVWLTGEALFYAALAKSPTPATASAIYNLTPVIVLALSMVAYGRGISITKALGFCIILLSVYLMNQK